MTIPSSASPASRSSGNDGGTSGSESTSRTASPARGWVWVQLLIAWLPVVALYALIITTVHGGAFSTALVAAARAISAAAVLGWLVLHLTRRLPWPRPMTARFILAQFTAALAFAGSWVLLTSLIESVLRWRLYVLAPAGLIPFVLLGLWLYVAVAGVAYAMHATARAARAEAIAAESRLQALRGQLNPHFLFNALHTVVQLIPVAPDRAETAAEQIAGLLRTGIEEDRDLIPLREELSFVRRYTDLEQTRFGDRLGVRMTGTDDVLDALVPSFAVQTLVENAIRHGAEPSVEPTRVEVSAVRSGDRVQVTVSDTGAGVTPDDVAASPGTGLRRLRERLAVLYGDAGMLTFDSTIGAGSRATITVPLMLADR